MGRLGGEASDVVAIDEETGGKQKTGKKRKKNAKDSHKKNEGEIDNAVGKENDGNNDRIWADCDDRKENGDKGCRVDCYMATSLGHGKENACEGVIGRGGTENGHENDVVGTLNGTDARLLGYSKTVFGILLTCPQYNLKYYESCPDFLVITILPYLFASKLGTLP